MIDLLNKPLNVIWMPVTRNKDSGGLRAGEMYGEETAERQYPKKKKKITQRESDYDKETETRNWESSMKRKKKSLVEDSGHTDLDKGRTMGKSDLAVSRPNESRTRIFTNTAVPRFDGTSCWEQHLLVFQAIVKSNGWSSDTAALQMVAHLNERHFKWHCWCLAEIEKVGGK